MTALTRQDRLLRTALRGNGVFSSLSGAVFILFAPAIADFLGVTPDSLVIIALIGVGLLIFAASLFWNAGRADMDTRLVAFAILGDALWVVGSVLVLLLDPFSFTTAGRWAVLIIADTVLIFGILQFVGLRRRN